NPAGRNGAAETLVAPFALDDGRAVAVPDEQLVSDRGESAFIGQFALGGGEHRGPAERVAGYLSFDAGPKDHAMRFVSAESSYAHAYLPMTREPASRAVIAHSQERAVEQNNDFAARGCSSQRVLPATRKNTAFSTARPA